MAACGLGLVASALWYDHGTFALPLQLREARLFLAYAAFDLPYFFIAVLIYDSGLMQAVPRWSLRMRYTLFAMALLAVLLFFQTPHDWAIHSALKIAKNVLITLLFVFLPIGPSRIVTSLSGISYGVYLSHEVFIPAFLLLEKRMPIAHPSIMMSCAFFVAVYVSCAIFCLGLARAKWTRWLVC